MFVVSNAGVQAKSSPYPNPFPASHNLRSRSSESFVYTHRSSGIPEGQLRIVPANHCRALRAGLELMRKRPLVVLGMSPGNAFFTRKRIEIAVCGMARLFGEVAVIVPDTIAVHTYRALGYDEKQSKAKAREHGVNIKNRCLRAIERARIETPSAKLRMLDWEQDVASLPSYANSYAKVCELFETHEQFRKDVLAKGRSLLASKLSPEAVTDAATRECIEYLLKEFAYFNLLRTAFGREVVVPYHQDFKLGYNFCDGGYQAPLPGVGWLIYDIELQGEARQSREVSYAN